MIIRLICKEPELRLIWQNRIMQFQDTKAFRFISQSDMHLVMPSEEVMEFSDCLFSKSEVEVMVWLMDESGKKQLYKAFEEGAQWTNHLVVVLPEGWSATMTLEEREKLLKCSSAIANEVLDGDVYTRDLLFQRLFKPRTQQRQQLSTLVSDLEKKAVISDIQVENKVAVREGGIKHRFRDIRERMKACLQSTNEKILQGIRLKICIMGDGGFAYELAAAIAYLEKRQVLVMDLDRLAPSADVYAGVKPILKGSYDFFSKTSATGLNVILDCCKKGELHSETFQKCTQPMEDIPNCRILTGAYRIQEYEYYNAEEMAYVVDKAAGYYDVVIMKTNAFPYDGFTLMAMRQSDVVITALPPSIDKVRAHRNLLEHLEIKQKIKIKNQYVAFYENGPLSQETRRFLESLTRGTCLGWMPNYEKRQVCQTKGATYLKGCILDNRQLFSVLLEELYKERC